MFDYFAGEFSWNFCVREKLFSFEDGRRILRAVKLLRFFRGAVEDESRFFWDVLEFEFFGDVLASVTIPQGILQILHYKSEKGFLMK